ncbi:cryptochrome/photolyase family protein [Patiriisocius sp. Uisw_017]|uniref:cryptochrome/photolyase family protein n=1 Tax=Patiriisocius sp. Uisw_017 TaxID=3230968 RepID=UPI0039E95725
MTQVNLIFPHQLFEASPLFENVGTFIIIEEILFFSQYNFHKQKLAFHRGTMKAYEAFLVSKKIKVRYVSAKEKTADVRVLIDHLKTEFEEIHYIDPTDYLLSKRIKSSITAAELKHVRHDSPLFINTPQSLKSFFTETKKKFHQTSFYIQQRKELEILLINGDPEGGSWTFDKENRKKYPTKKTPPPVHFPAETKYHKEAKEYVTNTFSKNLGEIEQFPLYPINFKESKIWLEQFLEQRFFDFGIYEDAIVDHNSFLNHSVLSPLLNVGLLSPNYVVERALAFAKENDIPINSTEGFVRQIIGWREFMRGMYEAKGVPMRTSNFWKHTRKIPKSFYDGTTGILPIDTTIKKALKTGYSHHIERLMILGNFMLLCEFDPKEVYRWFMELFIDAYDWVMVPNVYGMSQFSDGGFFATKPYISGSNYVLKMSNYKKGDWQPIWDGLFWNFMDKNRIFFKSNPRLGMLLAMFDKMPIEKRETHLTNAAKYLKSLD